MRIRVKPEECVGKRFGKLVVLRVVDKTWDGRTRVECICDCGNLSVKVLDNIKSRQTTSCGCNKPATHGLMGHPLYSIWKGIKARCDNKNTKAYKYYGDRGISYESEWKSFINFYNDMVVDWEEGLSIERKDTNKDYSRSNCIWISVKDQSRNKGKRVNNKSGVNGVYYAVRHNMWVATWQDSCGEKRSKSFTVKKHGDSAFRLACEYRIKMIEELKEAGVYYGEHHGLDRLFEGRQTVEEA